MKRNIFILFILIFILVPLHATAQEDSVFSLQCADMSAAEFSNWTVNEAGWTIHEKYPLIADQLWNVDYTPGEWLGYSHPEHEFGRDIITDENNLAIKVGSITTETSCGTYHSAAYPTYEGDVLLILEKYPIDTIALYDVCSEGGHDCARHEIWFAYVDAAEWYRVTRPYVVSE